MRECPTTLVADAITRLHQTESRVHAYVRTFEKQAIDRAGQLDDAPEQGPLHGIPFGVKEVFDIAGVETTGGSPVLAGHVADADAEVVRRLREAGAVLLGTQVSHELTCGLDQPATRNPWNLDCYPGGSSAGAGVSVTVGSAAFAIGTDAAGSVRIPAAMTGVVGFKPSSGAVSKKGVIREASAPSIDNVGVVAGDVALVADVFGAIAFPDPGDAHTLLRRPQFPQRRVLRERELEGRRVAVLGERTVAMLDHVYEQQADVREAFQRICDRLRGLGVKLVTLELPTIAKAGSAVFTLFSQELAFAHRSRIENGNAPYHQSIRDMLAASVVPSPSSLDEAVEIRTRLSEEVEVEFSKLEIEALMTPTSPRVAMPLSSFHPVTELATLIPYTCGFNLSGHPAISLPNGLDRNGMPIGLQLVGRLYQDASLLQLAACVEQLSREGMTGSAPI